MDKRKLGTPLPPATEPDANQYPAGLGVSDIVEPPAAATPPQPTSPSAAASGGTDIAPPEVEPTVPDRRFTKVPTDAIFPSGIIVGEDNSVIDEIRDALAALGSEVERVDSTDAARQMIVSEQPNLCIYVAGRIQTAPHAALAPLTRLHPGIRRCVYLMLIADNLKTCDSTAAFMHEVNMVLGRQDLPQIGAALYAGLEYHSKLYKAYSEACDKKGSI